MSRTPKPALSIQEMIQSYRSVYQRFEKIEGRPWKAEGILIELFKQAGEAAKQVMVLEHFYFPKRSKRNAYRASKEQLGDELADMLAQLIRLADYYQVDLPAAFQEARRKERISLRKMRA